MLLYAPVLDARDYVVAGSADGRIALGALFEILRVVTIIGTAVVLFPIARRRRRAGRRDRRPRRARDHLEAGLGLQALIKGFRTPDDHGRVRTGEGIRTAPAATG